MEFLPHQTEEELKGLIVRDLTEKSGVQISLLTKYCTAKVFIQCIVCQQPKVARYSGLLKRQGLTCSKECNHSLRSASQKEKASKESIQVKTKRIEALQDRFKDKSWADKVLLKRKETCLERWGVEHTSKVESIRDSISEGVQSAYANEDILKKRFQTNSEKYGHRNFLASTAGQIIVKATNRVRFGTDFPFQNSKHQKVAKEVAKRNLLQKYNVDNAARSPELLAKRVARFHQNRFQNGKDYSKSYWLSQTYGYNCRIVPEQELPEHWGKGSLLRLLIVCGICDKKWIPVWNDIVSGRTQTCGCKVGVSVAELRVYEYVKQLCVDAIHTHKIDDIEVDIFIPSRNVAIEYNGLYWHRAEVRQQRDAAKARKLRELGIRYVGIFEDEWLQKEEMVKSHLATICGEKKKVKQLRPQQVKVIFSKNTSQIREFLQKYHYGGGNTPLSEVWCIYDGSTLIGILGCGTPTRNQIKEDIELKRICSHPDYHVPGLWSYLLKNYVSKYYTIGTDIISFSDNRRDTGNLYKAIGFIEVGQVRPDYYWCMGQQRFHKAKFQNVTKIQDELTENEYMTGQGYFKVYDCGKTKWLLKIGGNIDTKV